MADPKTRARVQRLIGGDIRNDDLMNIFLFARDHCDGRESVKEIGDFVAHHADRNRGIITRTTRDWEAITTFFNNRIKDGKIGGVDWNSLPPVTPRYLEATLRRMDHKAILRHTKMSRADAVRLLPATIKKLHKNDDGTFAVTRELSNKDRVLLQALCSVIAATLSFDSQKLHLDLVATLKSNGAISAEEIKEADHLYPLTALFAVAAMHNCCILLDDKTTTALETIFSGPHINVGVGVPLPNIRNNVRFMQPVYQTDLSPADHCTAELLNHGAAGCDIELSPEGKLDILAIHEPPQEPPIADGHAQ